MTDFNHKIARKELEGMTDREVFEAYVELRVCKHHLLELLAVVHRDGGHYTVKHGVEKSAQDAEKIVFDLFDHRQ